MARVKERVLTWIAPTGETLKLSDYYNGYQVLEGIQGFDSPPYDSSETQTPNVDGSTWLGARASSRDLFVPLHVWGPDRQTFLSRKSQLFALLNPQRGQQNAGVYNTGTLRVEDIDGSSRQMAVFYKNGLEGDEGAEASGREYMKRGLVFRSVDAYWSSSEPESYVWAGAGPATSKFFPFFPLKLGLSQILSGSGSTVHNNVLNPSGEYGLSGYVATRDPGVAGPTPGLSRQTTFNQVGNYGVRLDWDAGTGEQWVEIELDGRTPGTAHLNHIRTYVHGTDQLFVGTLSDAETWIPGVSGVNFNGAGFQDGWSNWITHTTPSTAHGRLVIGKRSGTAGGFLVVDELQVNSIAEQDFPSDVYIDGDQANCVWEGTEGYSVSHRVPTFAPSSVIVGGETSVFPQWYFAGPLSDIVVTNNTTGRSFRFTVTLLAGQTLTLDARPRSMSATIKTSSGTIINAWPYLVSDDLFPLVLGNNDITLAVSGANANSSATLLWYPQYGASA